MARRSCLLSTSLRSSHGGKQNFSCTLASPQPNEYLEYKWPYMPAWTWHGFTGMPSSCAHCPATEGQGQRLQEALGNEKSHQLLEVPKAMRHFHLGGSGKTKGMWGSLQSLPCPYHVKSGASAIRNRTRRCCQGFQCFGTPTGVLSGKEDPPSWLPLLRKL